MPKRTDVESILIVGSGPIVIGQACEFDYSGTQACKILREEGYRVILINSNPATIMTDPQMSDRTYIEPIRPDIVAKVIEREKPDALLPTMGGQTSLNIAVSLAEEGVLDKFGVELIGANFGAIKKAEDRQQFEEAMRNIGLDLPKGGFVTNKSEAFEIVKTIGFPVIIRPSFTLGGSGGNIAYNIKEYEEYIEWGLTSSPISKVLVEESILGWKEYELEVMRDLKDNVIIICSIENFDPMGIHTGDSITVAPAQTLTDKEYQRMRDAAIKIIREIGVDTGGSNIQFAVHPQTGRMVVIEMNPRVSRSSALASKATGFPIAKIAAKLAIGYTLDEIDNDITKKTPASFEPAIDYIVVKIPRWDFEKFPQADNRLSIYMKSVGEAMAFGRTFKEALQKALRSLEIGRYGLGADGEDIISDEMLKTESPEALIEQVRTQLQSPKSDNIFFIRYAFKLGLSVEELYAITTIDPWFLYQIREIVEFEDKIIEYKGDLENFPAALCRKAKRLGFSDFQLGYLLEAKENEVRKFRIQNGIIPTYKTVDTCAAEFEAETPYYYSTYETENESERTNRKKIVILGGGPNRIGQGIEFDYCCVQGVFALQEENYETLMINCNPETVSTDYDTTDKLYFEPLTFEDVMNILDVEQPDGVVVQFGGQTPLKLAKALEAEGITIIGTSPENIDLAEDRKRFGALLEKLDIPHPKYGTAFSEEEALSIAEDIGFPVLVRPSYVLGGRAMEIVYDNDTLKAYMRKATQISPDHPVLIDRFLEDAFEFDVDAISDGRDVVIAGIMQHIEEAGIHSGDSACVLPPYMINSSDIELIKKYTHELAKALHVIGLINIQYAVKDDIVYVLEVNPRASRTVPFVSKTTGVSLAKLAAKTMVGRSLRELNFTQQPRTHHTAVKEVVLPFSKFPGVNIYLGPEMKSTGEVMGISESFGDAFARAHIGTNEKLPLEGTVFISVNDNDKRRVIPIARDFAELGFKIVATAGTANTFMENGLRVQKVFKVSEARPNIVDHIVNSEIQLIINTPLGKKSRTDEYQIGRSAITHHVPCITTLSGASAAVRAIRALRMNQFKVKSLQEYHEPVEKI